jgi:hypothetical protein
LWNTNDTTNIKKLLAYNSVECLKIISDLLVSGLDNEQILLWNITELLGMDNTYTYKPKTLNNSHRDKVTEVEYLEDKNILIRSSYD